MVLLEGTGTVSSKPLGKFSPQPQIVSSHTCAEQHCVEYSRCRDLQILLCRSPEFSLYRCLSLVLCPINCRHVGVPRLSASYPQLRKSTRLHINFLVPVIQRGNSHTAVSWSCCRAHFVCHLSETTVSRCQWPVF